MLVLDTNVLSEVMRPGWEPRVSGWMASQPVREMFTTSVCQAEILAGLAVMQVGQRRAKLQNQAREIFLNDFDGRILPFDSRAAIAYADVFAARRRVGRIPSRTDMMIAAIALSRDAVIVTRNVADFTDCGVRIVNPWDP